MTGTTTHRDGGGPTSEVGVPVVRGLLFLCLAGIIWGTIGPGLALVSDASDLNPATITSYRALFAVAALAIAALLGGQVAGVRRILREQPGRVVCVGVLTVSFQLLYFVAVREIGVSVATVITLGLPPALLLILESVRRRRAPSPRQTVTMIVAVVGLAMVALVGQAGPAPGDLTLGLITATLGGVAFALSADVGTPLSQRHGAVAVASSTMGVAALVLLPVGVAAGMTGEAGLAPESARVWLLIAYLGVVTMALAYALLFAGLRTTPGSAAVVATLLEPVTAVAIAVAFLGESLSAAGAIGSALIVAAIASLGMRKRPQPQ